MKKLTACAAAVLMASVGIGAVQEMQEMPKPEKEHKWLSKFVGEWESEMECMIPGMDAMKSKGTEKCRMLGDFWMISEGDGEIMGMKFSSVLTIGYDPKKKKFVGSWIDSMSNYMWHYEGSLDAEGKVLTLETKGPNPMNKDKTANFKEVIEFKSDTHRVFTSSMQGDDGQWQTFVTANAKKKS